MGKDVPGHVLPTETTEAAELDARLRILVKAGSDPDVLVAGPIRVDGAAYSASVDGTPLDLTYTEFELLRYLMLNTNRVLSKSQILDHVWEYDFGGDTGIVESYISYLRRKIDVTPETDAAGHPVELEWTPMIQTKRGVGYMLRTPESK